MTATPLEEGNDARVAARRLRDRLVGLGDCVSVAGDGSGLWTVHVHCDDVGAAIEFGVEAGRPHRIRVARFADAPTQEPDRFLRDRAVVAPQAGLERLHPVDLGADASAARLAAMRDPVRLRVLRTR